VTLRELLTWIGGDAVVVALVCGLPPLLALLTGLVHKTENGGQSPWKYVYSALTYAACLPGLMATVVTVYAVGFAHENLLDLNAVTYLLPIVSMVATLVLVGMRVDFDLLPGFGRLSGLMTLIALTFLVVLFIMKSRVLMVFGGSIWTLIFLAGFVFALLKWGSWMAFRPRGAPERPAPRLSDFGGGDG
jgi:hypothetical protein